MLNFLLAHAGETHAEESVGILARTLHQPTWIGLVLVVAVSAALFYMTKLLKLSFPARLLVTVASLIVLGILYMPHNASVTGIILSAGFVGTFLLTFTMLARPPK